MTRSKPAGEGANPVVPHPAATVVLLREGSAGCEVLLVRRSSKLAFHGGAWVFPGGRIDAEDFAPLGADADVAAAARLAAVREAREEVGVSVDPEELVLFARWVTPEGLPKRFDAWFFAAPAPDGRIQVDGGEIEEHRWFRPAEALEAKRSGAIDLPPPTFVTLTQFCAAVRVDDCIAGLRRGSLRSYVPRLHMLPEGCACSLYEGDIGYESGDPERDGPRHRLWMRRDGSWVYECTVDGVSFDIG